jgi:hypothetical protein
VTLPLLASIRYPLTPPPRPLSLRHPSPHKRADLYPQVGPLDTGGGARCFGHSVQPPLPVPLSPAMAKRCEPYSSGLRGRVAAHLPPNPGRRSRVTVVTRSLALGYPRWPLQGQKPLSVQYCSIPCVQPKRCGTRSDKRERGQVSGVPLLYSPILGRRIPFKPSEMTHAISRLISSPRKGG